MKEMESFTKAIERFRRFRKSLRFKVPKPVLLKVYTHGSSNPIRRVPDMYHQTSLALKVSKRELRLSISPLSMKKRIYQSVITMRILETLFKDSFL
jgi:hypothetical protein